MTTFAEPACRTLAEYLTALVAVLDSADPPALERLRATVGKRRARIGLDDEAVDVAFGAGGNLEVVPAAAGEAVDGEGYTDRATVLDLLGGYLEVTEAVTLGRLAVRGEATDVVRIFQAIEILLDASPRTPALQDLADDFKADPCRQARFVARPALPSAGTELVLLGRLKLLELT